MSAPRKAVFAQTQSEARRILRAFALPSEEWFAYGFDNALAGRQFDHVVIKMPCAITPGLFDKLGRIRTRLSPDAREDII
ncbi:hypothetical protein [uncultured Methylobacterium sp.]|jgi:hypothetical protein|uniref:hypothetical protein n=1 Tax=uncultured Methylobacterium sp. TaxID=157278 RepID=UPI002605F515|nr:hypothetical protein [uncultured Methylobacterium sp.]